jgi:hypothetical protein
MIRGRPFGHVPNVGLFFISRTWITPRRLRHGNVRRESAISRNTVHLPRPDRRLPFQEDWIFASVHQGATALLIKLAVSDLHEACTRSDGHYRDARPA